MSLLTDHQHHLNLFEMLEMFTEFKTVKIELKS